MDDQTWNSEREKQKAKAKSLIQSRLTQKRVIRRLRRLLRQSSDQLSAEDVNFMKEHESIASTLRRRREQAASRRVILQKRFEEHTDDPESLDSKLDKLAGWIRKAGSNIVVYTGAGISTAASIPDYRGPSGKWTLLHNSEASGSSRRQPAFSLPEATSAAPTTAHLVLAAMVEAGLVSYVVSQNVDCLHVRSGVPLDQLSELHGNLFIELCSPCERAIFRLVDVSERSRFRHHRTGRCCSRCRTDLSDSIVHFGEKSREGGEPGVYRWGGALAAVRAASMVLCFGSSLAVLRHYAGLWPKTLGGPAPKQRLVIVNLQWTSKDRLANLKINASCDEVMSGLAKRLNIEPKPYCPKNDPLLKLATPFTAAERKKVTRPFLDLDSTQ